MTRCRIGFSKGPLPEPPDPLYHLRVAAGIPLRRAAEFAGVPAALLSDFEHSRAEPGPAVRLALEAYYARFTSRRA
jgi:hypothetical protein